ncbi:hypothetical protein [Kineococcus sp. SYSU DK018]|uniref:hypothetical protein n=1 Tax=Kineococcus sp. SYSU DK018 TaxID=3383139 RepID=UPI003D7E7A20
MTGDLAAVHVASALVGLVAAATGLLARARWRDRALGAHVVMTAAMLLCLVAALQVDVPVGLLLLLAVASWVGAWTRAAADRRAQRRSGLPLDLLATGSLLLLMPMSHAPAPVPAGSGHLHATGASTTAVLALVVAGSWLAVSLLRCRAGREGAAGHGSGLLPSVCAAGMAGSMVVMVAVAV